MGGSGSGSGSPDGGYAAGLAGSGWLVAGSLLAGLPGLLATGLVGTATGAYEYTTGSTEETYAGSRS